LPDPQFRFTEEEKNLVLEALKSHGAMTACPRCANANFLLLDGYTQITLHRDRPTENLSKANLVPAVSMACMQCGFISTHALGALGLLQRFESQAARTEGRV
jgi:hypothetical protein